MHHGLAQLVVEVAHAQCNAVRQAEAGAHPRPHALVFCTEHLFERAALHVLEHEAELVRALVPARAEHEHEVRVLERRHDLRGARSGRTARVRQQSYIV